VTVTPLTKKCRRCGRIRSADRFYASSSAPDGLQYQCKACDRKRARTRKLGDDGDRSPCKFGKFCSKCCGLPHRVKGGVCEECGLEYKDE